MAPSCETNKPSANGHKNNPKEGKHWLEYAIFGFVVITAVATAAAACYTRNQWLTAEDTKVRQLRAYLHVLTGGFHIDNLESGELQLMIEPRFRVFGQTPAGNISIAWIPIFVPAPIGPGTEIPNYLPGLYLSTLVAPPGEDQFIIPKALKIGPVSQGQLKAGSHVVAIVGTVLYLDIFKTARFTNFCYSFSWQDIQNHRGEPCAVHNQTDWSNGQPAITTTTNVPM
jgi:hypothetical protein